jgi:hypothetical protein
MKLATAMVSPTMLLRTALTGKQNRTHKKGRDTFANPVAKLLCLSHYRYAVRIAHKGRERRAMLLTRKKKRTELSP